MSHLINTWYLLNQQCCDHSEISLCCDKILVDEKTRGVSAMAKSRGAWKSNKMPLLRSVIFDYDCKYFCIVIHL